MRLKKPLPPSAAKEGEYLVKVMVLSLRVILAYGCSVKPKTR
jgi:hypothetical protein